MNVVDKLLVTGLGRSGTTLVSNLLNAQSEAVVYSDFLTAIYRVSRPMGVTSFLDPITHRQRNVLLAELNREFADASLPLPMPEDEAATTLLDIYEHALVALSESVAEDIKLVGSKVSGVKYWLPTVLEETDVKVVYVHRDPRDILLSRKNRFPAYRLLDALLHIQEASDIVRGICDPKLHTLRFEDLVRAPETTLGELSGFLGVDITRFTTTYRNGHTWDHNSSFQDLEGFVDERAVERWRSVPEAPEVRFTEVLQRSLLDDLGYPEGPEIPPMERAAIHTRWAVFHPIKRAQRLQDKVFHIARGRLDPT